MPIVGPVFCYDDTLQTFEDEERAAAHFEAWNVLSPRTFYDSEGRLLKLVMEARNFEWRAGKRVPAWPHWHIALAEDQPNHSSELRQIIVDELVDDGGSSDELGRAALSELVERWKAHQKSPLSRPSAPLTRRDKAVILVAIVWPVLSLLSPLLLLIPALPRRSSWLLALEGKGFLMLVEVDPVRWTRQLSSRC